MSWSKAHFRFAKIVSASALVLTLCLPLTGGTRTAGTAEAASASPSASAACGSGNQALLQDLQAKHKGAGETPLHFADVDFLSDTTGRAAGNGFLIGTSDGGCSWQAIYKGSWQFSQILFPGNVKGWALAAAQESGPSYLLSTSDGGSHWKRIDSAGNLSFLKISYVDGTLFGFTTNAVYKSADQAKSWKKISTPPNTRAGSFEDAAGSRGYVLTIVPGGGYKVMKTTNGGASWSRVLTIPSISNHGGAVYSSGGQVWALAYGESGMSQISYSLYASRDGGTDWTRVIAQDTAGGGPAPGSGKALAAKGPASPGGHPGNMELVGSSTAYLAGGSPAGGTVGVGRSYNAGQSWENAKASIKGYDARISFPSQKTGWLAVTSVSSSAVYVTHDGGASWNQKFQLPESDS
ncbi:YCF48-related protein [Paenibacillus pinistramenti]|uniref:YCF48-related protein n=1 Tax=Paenibacillus pinistramenti TaxID=1768003 RepID=UPI0011097DC1|nr:YCF48-related protein [Paenibacillus pinistramenti]